MNKDLKDDDDGLNFRKRMQSVKGLAFIGSADILGSGISALFWLTVATLVLVEEYGQISYFISIASIGLCSLVGSPNALMVFSTKYQKIIPTILFLTLIFTMIGSLIAFIIVQRFEIIFLMFSFIIFEASITILLGKKLYTKYSTLFVAQKIIQFGLGIGLSFLLGVNGVIIGIVLANFLLIIVFYKELRA